MSVLLFFVVIFVLVLVHEFGHFWMAKKTGMRVDEFGIGFPPKVASIKKGETEYSFNLLPIGGFVRIFGEDALEASSPVPSPDGKPDAKLDAEPGLGGTNSNTRKNLDFDRSFIAKSPLQQSLVLIAGVTMNMMFAWFLFILVFAIGIPTVVDEADASPDARLIVSEVLADSPAAEVGLPRGAVITGLSYGNESDQILNVSSFQAFTEDRPEQALEVTYTYAGEEKSVSVMPETGLVEEMPERAVMGVALAMVDVVSEPIHVAVIEGTKQTYNTLIAVTVGISTLVYDALLFQADLSGVAGPVGIVGLVEEASQFGLTSLLLFTALISINLAVINLLPFPALDGGRLLFVAIEVIKGSPIRPVWVARLNTLGFFLLILLMVAVTWSDIAKIISFEIIKSYRLLCCSSVK